MIMLKNLQRIIHTNVEKSTEFQNHAVDLKASEKAYKPFYSPYIQFDTHAGKAPIQFDSKKRKINIKNES